MAVTIAAVYIRNALLQLIFLGNKSKLNIFGKNKKAALDFDDDDDDEDEEEEEEERKPSKSKGKFSHVCSGDGHICLPAA